MFAHTAIFSPVLVKVFSAFVCTLFFDFPCSGQTNLARNAVFSVQNFGSKNPYKTGIVPGNQSRYIYGAMECLREDLCLSFDVTDNVINLYNLSVYHGGTRYLKTRCQIIAGMKYSKVLDMCYRRHPSTTDWFTANNTCAAEGGRLAVLDTEEKFSQLIVEFNEPVWSVWLGALWTGSRWEWINGQELLLSNPHWHTGQPDTPGDDCVLSGRYRFGHLGLEDISCSLPRYPLCEY